MKKIILGNEAIARGAYEAGVRVATAYPGTPSTEITEFVAEYPEIYAEWAPNEKVALEVAIGASFAGARAMCCMKHVGVNVAADPLFTVAYTGILGGLVLVAADDPGMHSSQNEQDSRYYAISAGIPMLEPADSEECKQFMIEAYALSEEYDTPVMVRTTTRISHSQSPVEFGERSEVELKPYVKDVAKYAMMPANAKHRHIAVEKRMNALKKAANTSPLNCIEYQDKSLGIICSGAVYQYVKEALPEASVLKLGMVHPLPMELIASFAGQVDRLIVAEELDGVIEGQIRAAGIQAEGKNLFSIQGELSAGIIREKLFGEPIPAADSSLPVRPPVMCAGCPHRGVFYVLKEMKLTVTADIGCYTLGAQPPLSAVDTVVCMGASIGMAHGFEKALGREKSKQVVAVIGDSTFVHSGITGIVDAVYNKGASTVLILDNSTTGMTGHQQNPATGVTLKEEKTHQLDLEQVVRACGVAHVQTVDAYDMQAVKAAITEAIEHDAVSVIIARRPCVLLRGVPRSLYQISERCVRCKACLKIGCPAIIQAEDGHIEISKTQCTGCGVCRPLCKFGAIAEEEKA